MENYLDDYLSLCNHILESADLLRSYLVELKLSDNYDENMLYDAFDRFDQDVNQAHGLQYMAIGTRIKRLVQSKD